MSVTHEENTTDLAQPIFANLGDDTTHLFVLSPTRMDVSMLVKELNTYTNESRREELSVTILSSKDPIRSATEYLDVGLILSDLIADGKIELCLTDDVPNRVFVGEGSSLVLTEVGGVTVLHGSSDVNIDSFRSHIESLAESADSYDVRLPPLSKVRTAIRERFSEDIAEDFDVVFDELSDDDRDYSHADLFLAIAAYNEELLYDISRFGEDLGIASAATFSRSKKALEDREILNTQKVPIDVGRPRQKLILTEEYQDRVESPSDLLSIL
jgi:hypothetical protein